MNSTATGQLCLIDLCENRFGISSCLWHLSLRVSAWAQLCLGTVFSLKLFRLQAYVWREALLAVGACLDIVRCLGLRLFVIVQGFATNRLDCPP